MINIRIPKWKANEKAEKELKEWNIKRYGRSCTFCLDSEFYEFYNKRIPLISIYKDIVRDTQSMCIHMQYEDEKQFVFDMKDYNT